MSHPITDRANYLRDKLQRLSEERHIQDKHGFTRRVRIVTREMEKIEMELTSLDEPYPNPAPTLSKQLQDLRSELGIIMSDPQLFADMHLYTQVEVNRYAVSVRRAITNLEQQLGSNHPMVTAII